MRRARSLVALTSALTGVLAVIPAAASTRQPAAAKPCFGHTPTIVSTANGAAVNGTAHSDVILATGTGVTVRGGGGNDYICVGHARSVDGGAGNDHIQFVSGTIHGGVGNDTLVQKRGGRAKVFGDAGNDAVRLVTAGDFVDTGTGLDTLSVPSSVLDRITIVDRDGLVVNGQSRRIDAPRGAPTADIAYNGDPGPVVYAPTTDPSDVLNAPGELELAHVLAPNGRTLTSWSVSFGDGYVRTGFGGLPATIRHPFLFDGPHTIVATQVDSSHKTVTRTIVVNTSGKPDVGLSNGPSAPDPTRNFTDSVSAGSGAGIAAYVMDFGDGSAPQANVAPVPPTFTHNYPIGHWTARLTVYDDHGNIASDTAIPAAVPPADATARQIYLAAAVDSASLNPTLFEQGVLPGPPVPLPSGGSVLTGQVVNLFIGLSDASTYDSYTLDWGDGCVSTDVDGPPSNHAGPCTGTDLSHAYTGPGTRTITVTLGKAGQPPVTASLVVNVSARQTVAELQRVGVVPQGPVAMSTKGTTVAPGQVAWVFDPGDGRPVAYGYGTVPPVLAHTYPSGVYFPSLTVTDHFGLVSSAVGFVDATSQRARAVVGGADLGELTPAPFSTSDLSAWVGGLVSTDSSGNDSVGLSGFLIPSNGARPQSAVVTFGDGSSPQTIHGVVDGRFGGLDATHGYTKPGEVTARLLVRDTHKQVAAATTHVSISGPVTLGPPNDVVTVNAQSGSSSVPVSIPIQVSTGANAQPDAYTIIWGGGIAGEDPVTGAYGTLPSTLTRLYANPGGGPPANHTITITYRNDHGSTAVLRIRVVVNGA